MQNRATDRFSSVAVLLAAFNGIKWIEEQIESILSQKNVSIKIFLSVDVSNDGTYEWCSSLAMVDDRIEVLPYGEKFGGAAKNFFRLIRDVDFSDFNYVALSDQDDVWFENKIECAVKSIKQNNLDGYSSDIIAFWPSGRKKTVKKSFPQRSLDYLFESAGPGCTYVMRQKSIQRFKVFLTDNWSSANLVELHDWMIYAYFRSQGMRWEIDSKSLMYYRQHSNNQLGLNSGLSAYIDRFYKIKSKWYRNEVIKISSLVNQNFCLENRVLISNFRYLRRRFRDRIILLLIIIFRIF